VIVDDTQMLDRTAIEPTTRIYRLTPINPRDPNWRGSVHRNAAVVRAGSEDLARSLAAKAFNSTLIPSAPGRVIPSALWQRSDAVRAEIIEDRRYRPDGTVGILEPWGFS
jgi:hypothetical protein